MKIFVAIVFSLLFAVSSEAQTYDDIVLHTGQTTSEVVFEYLKVKAPAFKNKQLAWANESIQAIDIRTGQVLDKDSHKLMAEQVIIRIEHQLFEQSSVVEREDPYQPAFANTNPLAVSEESADVVVSVHPGEVPETVAEANPDSNAIILTEAKPLASVVEPKSEKHPRLRSDSSSRIAIILGSSTFLCFGAIIWQLNARNQRKGKLPGRVDIFGLDRVAAAAEPAFPPSFAAASRVHNEDEDVLYQFPLEQEDRFHPQPV